MTPNLTTHKACMVARGASPWTIQQRLCMLVWEYVWLCLCAWTPKPFYKWRLCILRLFGAQIEGSPFVHQRARIQIPWNLVIKAEASIGDRANIYNLDRIVIGQRAIIAQEAYLCSGTHDLLQESIPLQTAPIFIEPGAFIGARAFILHGVTIGRNAIVGACSVVTRNVPTNAKVKGNPAR